MKTSETLQEFYTRTLPEKDVSKLLCCPGLGMSISFPETVVPGLHHTAAEITIKSL